MADTAAWLPADFVHPVHVDLPGSLHLRPIRADDVDIDLPAVHAARDRLWATYGESWGWPPVAMTREQDREDLAHHAAEIEAHETFNYALLDEGETRLLGCVYLDPVRDAPREAESSWWFAEGLHGTPLAHELDVAVLAWLRTAWPFAAVRLPHNS